MEALEQWHRVRAQGIAEGPVSFVSCPVCGAALIHTDTQGLARHVLWHHDRGEWPWENVGYRSVLDNHERAVDDH